MQNNKLFKILLILESNFVCNGKHQRYMLFMADSEHLYFRQVQSCHSDLMIKRTLHCAGSSSHCKLLGNAMFSPRISQYHCVRRTFALKCMGRQLPESLRGMDKQHTLPRSRLRRFQRTKTYVPVTSTIWKLICRSQNNFAWICP